MIIFDEERRAQLWLLYRAVQTGNAWHYFSIDSECKLSSFLKMAGKGLLLGLREDKPNKSTDQGLVINDVVNMTSKIVLFISSSIMSNS